MEIAGEIARRQMQPDQDTAFFQLAKNRPLPEVIASEEFKKMPLERKRKIMDMFNQQAMEQRSQKTMLGTSAIGAILPMLLAAGPVAKILSEGISPVAKESIDIYRALKPQAYVPKGTIVMP